MLQHRESLSSQDALPDGGDHAVDMVSYGVPFRLSAKSGALLDLMRQQAPFGSVECRSVWPDARTFALRSTEPDAHYQVTADDELLLEAKTLGPALIQLGGHMMIHVAEYAPDLVFIHSGAVAWQDRALLLPGQSHAGKSTLVAELVRAGATYYSDEFALLDCEGKVHPFTRDLRMRNPGLPDQTPIPLAQLNGRAGTEALVVAMVVFAEFAEGARWAPEPVLPGRAVLEMLLHSTPVQRTPGRVLATLTAVMRHATAWRSQRGEAEAAARSLLAALATGELPV
jgi:hypothetical protein